MKYSRTRSCCFDKRIFHDLVRHGRRYGGSHDTHSRREETARRLCIWLRENNIQVRHASGVRNAHVRDFISELKSRGLSPGTLQNTAAGLRKCAPRVTFSNRELGIPKRSREGKRVPCPDELYNHAREQIIHPGMRACLALQRHLGLRALEGIAAGPSVHLWLRALLRGAPPYVVHGTKGGRSRYVHVADREAAIAAVKEACAVRSSRSRGQHLIAATSRNAAINRYHDACRNLGLTGVHSPHSLRYRFAQDLVAHFASRSYPKKEAFAAVSLSLGHGDGRGEYIRKVYGRGMRPYSDLVRARPALMASQRCRIASSRGPIVPIPHEGQVRITLVAAARTR